MLNIDITIKTYEGVSEVLLDTLVELEQRIFEQPYSREKLSREASTKLNLLALVAISREGPCGFKVGYESNERQYYSWIGGVIPECRGQGVAKMLMEKQHGWVKRKGFRSILTHTQNRFRGMLILNIKSGFEIIGVSRGSDSRTTIMLEKQLT